jgi:GxxExxY protein
MMHKSACKTSPASEFLVQSRHGFRYQQALAVELELRGVAFVQQSPVSIDYKKHDVGQARLDFLVANSLVVELKVVDNLAPIHTAQVISYLKATGCKLGLLINFNNVVLRDGIKRVILS